MRIAQFTFVLALSLALAAGRFGFSQEIPPPLPGDALPPPSSAEEDAARNALGGNIADDFDVQTRGPIHEAFAELYQPTPEPGLLITKQPPKPIDETPPDIKPEGEDVIWIPGYWGWDDDNGDFVWISGIWRRTPPGRQWVPGYWAEVEGGYRWVAGFWGEPGANIVYRQPPPASRDDQVILNAGVNDQFWVPGTWQWQDDQYIWNDGFYAPCRENWVWVPARWRWTPSGYIFLAGYWDFRPTVRAMLFAPVVFRPGVLLRPRYAFTPRVVIDPWTALNHFWVRPNYCHYYFGNYYGGAYADWGFRPFATQFAIGGQWDPIFCYYQSFYRRQGVDFHARLNDWNSYYVSHADLRPPRTWNDQVRFVQAHRGSPLLKNAIITSPLADFAAGPSSRLPLVSIDERARVSLAQNDARVARQLLAQREVAERARRDGATSGKASDFVNWKMPKVEPVKEFHALRTSGTPVGAAVRRDLEGAPTQRRINNGSSVRNEPLPRGLDRGNRDSSANDEEVRRADAEKAARKAEMDALRERFGNDPIRFQQEVDRMMSRRQGEPPNSAVRGRTAPDHTRGQASGRSGSNGSPDFRLLPRGSGAPPSEPGGNAPRGNSGDNGAGNNNGRGGGNRNDRGRVSTVDPGFSMPPHLTRPEQTPRREERAPVSKPRVENPRPEPAPKINVAKPAIGGNSGSGGLNRGAPPRAEGPPRNVNPGGIGPIRNPNPNPHSGGGSAAPRGGNHGGGSAGPSHGNSKPK